MSRTPLLGEEGKKLTPNGIPLDYLGQNLYDPARRIEANAVAILENMRRIFEIGDRRQTVLASHSGCMRTIVAPLHILRIPVIPLDAHERRRQFLQLRRG